MKPPHDPFLLRFGPVEAALLADWSQTQGIAHDPQHWHELNPILGTHPSPGAVNTYFALASVGNAALGKLPDTPRHVARGALLALELANVLRNRGMGIQFSAHF